MTTPRGGFKARLKVVFGGGVLVVGLALPSVAFASGSGQQSSGQQGTQVNPGSPAGQEYVIPIPAARREAAGRGTGAAGGGPGGSLGGGGGAGSAGGGGPGSASGNPPLFGIGVTPPSGGTAAGSGSGRGARSGGASSSHRSHSSSSSGATPAVAANERPVSLASVGHPSMTGGNAWLVLVGGGLLVIIVGGGGGFLVRRSLSRS